MNLVGVLTMTVFTVLAAAFFLYCAKKHGEAVKRRRAKRKRRQVLHQLSRYSTA